VARLTVVIGFMGAGKTTLARELAAARGVSHVDTDALLVARFGMSIPEVFAGEGEAAFRAAEEEVVLGVLDGAQGEDVVVSLGGGAVLAPRVRAALAGHTTVLLDVPLDVAWSRAAGRDRPLARDRDAFAALHGERQAVYESLADAHLPQGDMGVIVRADDALRALADAPEGTRMAWASAASGEYPVFVGRGVLALAGTLPGLEGRSFCVTDSAVAEHHLGGALTASLSGLVEIPPGEEHKTLATAERVWHALVAQGVTRADHLIVLRPSSAASRSCRRRRPSSRRSTRPTAARPVSTCPRPRTTSVPTTSPPRSWPTPPPWPRFRSRNTRPATPKSSRPR
jgi:shikimate kinase/3-dehydroquinate synthase